MKKTAILLTVFNRCNVTLQGLRSLQTAINYLPKETYAFDIYMTDDGCTDGTSEAVSKEFPEIKIIKGNGSLFWSGGMRKAWQTAMDSNINYDYYLWLNDDAILFEKALSSLFIADKELLNKAVISGAFCDEYGKVSYGGRTRDGKIMEPDGTYRDIFFMNGNLVLIPICVVEELGIIDSIYQHSLGDWDYGRRATKAGFRVVLTKEYVGKTDRHDNDMEPFLQTQYNIRERFKILYSYKCSATKSFIFNKKHISIIRACKIFFMQNLYALCPMIYKIKKNCEINV